MTSKALLARLSPGLASRGPIALRNSAPHLSCLRRTTLTTPTTVSRAIGLRHASTSSELATDSRSLVTRLKNLALGTSLVLFLGFGYLYITDTRAGVHQWLVIPSIRTIYPDAEDAHHQGNKALKFLYSFGLYPRERGDKDNKLGDLKVEVFGHVLNNPLGTSAGIDKGAEIPDALLALGPAIVEVGGITPRPQEGNAKPRAWRIESQNALINRYGLNSEGADAVAMRLRQRVREFAYRLGLGIDAEAERKVLDGEAGVPAGSLTPGRLMAVQIAKNKDTPDADIEAVERDYVYCVDRLAKYADIIVVNVSSPNTPGLRSLQAIEPLTHILTGVVQATKAAERKTKPAVMVKVSPDEDTEEQVSGICDAVWASGVDGVIVGNTTKKRPDPIPKGYQLPANEQALMLEQGGYSGPQMFERTLALVKKYRNTLDKGPTVDEEPSPKHVGPLGGADAPEDSVIEKVVDAVKPMAASAEAPVMPDTETTSGKDLVPSKPDDLEQSAPTVTLTHTTPSSSSEPASPADSKMPPPSNPFSHPPKVIFATGGITNGRQALEILNAGASVAMMYTSIVYGGVGTVTRVKEEMRKDIRSEVGPGVTKSV